MKVCLPAAWILSICQATRVMLEPSSQSVPIAAISTVQGAVPASVTRRQVSSALLPKKLFFPR